MTLSLIGPGTATDGHSFSAVSISLEERPSISALEPPPSLFLFSSESVEDTELNTLLTSPTTQPTSFSAPSSCGSVGLVSMEVQPFLPTFALSRLASSPTSLPLSVA